MFKEEREDSLFSWTMLGDVAQGRPNLGPTTDVSVYRLMQFTLRDVLIRDLGPEKADQIFYDAGLIAGRHFYDRLITKKNDINEFLGELQGILKDLAVGILRVEKADLDALTDFITRDMRQLHPVSGVGSCIAVNHQNKCICIGRQSGIGFFD